MCDIYGIIFRILLRERVKVVVSLLEVWRFRFVVLKYNCDGIVIIFIGFRIISFYFGLLVFCYFGFGVLGINYNVRIWICVCVSESRMV